MKAKNLISAIKAIENLTFRADLNIVIEDEDGLRLEPVDIKVDDENIILKFDGSIRYGYWGKEEDDECN